MRRVKEIIRYRCKGILEYGWLGKDIVVVVMDTGVSPHPELYGRIHGFKDFVNERPEMYDDNGHGTHVSGIIGGNTIGIAPECNIIMLKVLDASGSGKIEYSMRGFRWIVENQEKYNIRIVNISMGMEQSSDKIDINYILKAVEVLWDLGIVVVAAAGNLGPKEGTITIPGLSEKVITVGSADLRYSGRGSLQQDIIKPDLVAPGSHIYSSNAKWKENGERYYIPKSGTSMSTPIVSGAIADLLSKNPNITNTNVKKIIKHSCNNLGMDMMRQGNGMLDMSKLLK